MGARWLTHGVACQVGPRSDYPAQSLSGSTQRKTQTQGVAARAVAPVCGAPYHGIKRP